jgi:hypothetical protein
MIRRLRLPVALGTVGAAFLPAREFLIAEPGAASRERGLGCAARRILLHPPHSAA